MIICFNFLKNKRYVHKFSFRNSIYIKIYLESFIYLSFPSFTWNNVWKYFLQLEHDIELLVYQ